MQEADEPNAVVNFLDSQPLAGEHGWDVEPLAMHADAAAGGEEDSLSWKGYSTSGRPSQARDEDEEKLDRHSHGERFVRPLVVELADEVVETGLIALEINLGWYGVLLMIWLPQMAGFHF